MVYESANSKIQKWFNRNVIHELTKRDFDYYKLVNECAIFLNVTRTSVIRFLDMLIQTGRIKEIRIITATDEELAEFKRNIQQLNQEAEKELKNIT